MDEIGIGFGAEQVLVRNLDKLAVEAVDGGPVCEAGELEYPGAAIGAGALDAPWFRGEVDGAAGLEVGRFGIEGLDAQLAAEPVRTEDEADRGEAFARFRGRGCDYPRRPRRRPRLLPFWRCGRC